jgi:hypothetical protein
MTTGFESSWVHSETRVYVAEVRGQFENPEERERQQLEAGNRGLVKR